MKILIVLMFIATVSTSYSKPQLDAKGLKSTLNPTDLISLISYLTDADFKGRAAGGKEELIYTSKMVELFSSWGLVPAGDNHSFLQTFKFTSQVKLGKRNSLTLKGEKKPPRVMQDWIPLSFSQTGNIPSANIVFVGYGIEAPPLGDKAAYSSYTDLDVKGKWVLAFRYIPESSSGEFRNHLNFYSSLQNKAMFARNHGAQGLILVSGPNSNVKSQLMKLQYEGTSSNTSLAVISITDELANKWLQSSGHDIKELQDALDHFAPIKGFEFNELSLSAHIAIDYITGKGHNVLAMLPAPGATKTLIIGAHIDHLGLGESGNSLATAEDKKITPIHFGADDNASGVAGIMELAHFFSEQVKNKELKLQQNILFALWSGEEIGLLGSSHFTKKIQKNNYSAYLNLDMVGRLGKSLTIQGTGSSNYWPPLLTQAAKDTKLNLALNEDPYISSDAMPFYLAELPIASFFTGAHIDYHTPRDTVDKINSDGETQTLTYIAQITKQIVTESPNIPYKKVQGVIKKREGGRQMRIFLGTIPDFSAEGIKGVRISGVIKDSPGETAGLIAQDTIIELNNTRIENLHDYKFTIDALKPNIAIPIVVLRNEQQMSLTITPKARD